MPLRSNVLAVAVAVAVLLGLSSACLPRPVVPDRLTMTIPHPSATRTLPANEIATNTYNGVASDVFTLTEVSDRRVCLDAIFTIRKLDVEAADAEQSVAAQLKYARGDYMFFIGGSGGKIAPKLVSTMEPTRIAQEAGVRTVQRSVPTGRTATQCVRDIVNRYGTVVGCDRYEEVEETRSVSETIAATYVTYRAGVRWCAENDGLIDDDGEEFDFVFGGLRHRFRLTGGVAASAPWGAKGTSPLDGPTAAVREPASEARPEADRPAGPSAQAVPSPAGDPLAGKATARIDLTAVRIEVQERSGPPRTIAELRRDGTILLRGTAVGRLDGRGLFAAKNGTATFAIDGHGGVWFAKRSGGIEQVAEIGRGTIRLGQDGGTLTILPDGHLELASKRERRRSVDVVLPAGARRQPAALFLTYMAMGGLSWRR